MYKSFEDYRRFEGFLCSFPVCRGYQGSCSRQKHDCSGGFQLPLPQRWWIPPVPAQWELVKQSPRKRPDAHQPSPCPASPSSGIEQQHSLPVPGTTSVP